MKKLSIIFAALIAANSAFAETYDYEVKAKKLDEARNNLSPKTGASAFKFSNETIENMPQGQQTPLNQVLLRAPSVVASSQNQLYVRGDHANLQYRLNGVMLPQTVGNFSQVLDTHIAENIDFLTGAMPAQYGFRTAGVVDVKTKTGSFEKKNRSELMLGSYDTIAANQQVSGSKDKLNYFLSASYLQNSRGIESTSYARNVNHDDTSQDNIFGYFSYLLNDSQKLNLILSSATNRFEIPNNGAQTPEYNLAGQTSDSNFLNEKQSESNRFAIASLQGVSASDVDYQISLFSRFGDVKFKPDYNGDLIFNGISSSLDRSAFVNGIQGDFSYALNDKNTLRSGFFAQNERVKSATENYVFELDVNGDQTSGTPIRIDEASNKDLQLYGFYLQNEWKALDKLTLNYGARFDVSHAFVNESQLSPRLGAIYDFDKDTKIHAGFARYFTPPPVAAISESSRLRFNSTSNEGESQANDKVKAERTNYYDIGIAHKATKHLTLALDAYYKDIKNLLDEHQFGNSLIYSPFNYQKGKAYGAEFKADYAKDNFAAFFNFATLRAYGKNINTGQYIHEAEELEYIANNYVSLDHVQKYTASVGASYIFLKTKYSLYALCGNGLPSGENNKNKMPSYWQVNGAISRDFALPYLGKTNFRISAINLFDEVYQYSNGSGIGVSASQYAPRRSFYLTLVKNF